MKVYGQPVWKMDAGISYIPCMTLVLGCLLTNRNRLLSFCCRTFPALPYPKVDILLAMPRPKVLNRSVAKAAAKICIALYSYCTCNRNPAVSPQPNCKTVAIFLWPANRSFVNCLLRQPFSPFHFCLLAQSIASCCSFCC